MWSVDSHLFIHDFFHTSWPAVLLVWAQLQDNQPEETDEFMEEKSKQVFKFHSAEWRQDLAFMVDVTEHLNNKQLQGCNKVVTQYYESRRSFKVKLTLWKTHLAGGDAAHLPCLKNVCAKQQAAEMKRFKDK